MKVVELIDWKIASPQHKINGSSSLMQASQWHVSDRVWNCVDGKWNKQNGTTNDSINGSIQKDWESGSDKGRKWCRKRWSERVKHKRDWKKWTLVEGRKKIIWMLKPVLFIYSILFESLCVSVCENECQFREMGDRGSEGGGRLRKRRRQRSV